jgi:hypothetical protein
LLESEVEHLLQNYRGSFLWRDSTQQQRRRFKSFNRPLASRGIVGPGEARNDELAATHLVDPQIGRDAEKIGARTLHLSRLRSRIASANRAEPFQQGVL